MDHYNISFTVRMEFNSTGFYYIFSDNLYEYYKKNLKNYTI